MSQSGNEFGRGTRFLDREIPEDYLSERTSHVAAERRQIEVGTKSVVIFRISIEWFALSTDVFQEVTEYRLAHTVPHHRTGVLNGLVNVRGELLLSISLGALLQLEKISEVGNTAKRDVRGRLLICSRKGSRFAFPVNEVQGVHRYHPKDLRDIPATLGKSGTGTYVTGVLPWEDKTIGCLDEQLLFYAVDKGLA